MAQHLFVREGTKTRLGKAVQTVELRSSAEVVIVVRPHSANWLWVDLLVGAALGYVALLYTLFAPHVFGLVWIALIVPALFLAGVFTTRLVPSFRLALAGGERVSAAVRDAARARFVELNASATRERSAVLVYVSLSERRCAVVCDLGVIARVPDDALKKATARIESSVHDSGLGAEGLDALCASIEALGDVFEEPLPRAEDDENELEDVA